MTKITPQMWLDWQRSPATAAVLEHLETRKTSLIEQLLNLDIQSHSVESYGISAIAIRYHLEGMGEFLDLQNLEETLVQPVEGDA